MRYLLQNAQILSSGGVFRAADVLLSGGRIVSIGDRISCHADAVSIDLHKAVLFPGFVDECALLVGLAGRFRIELVHGVFSLSCGG